MIRIISTDYCSNHGLNSRHHLVVYNVYTVKEVQPCIWADALKVKVNVTINMNVLVPVSTFSFSFYGEECERWSEPRLFVLILSGAGSVSTQLALWITDLMTVVGEPTEFSSKERGKKSESEGKEYCLFQFSLAFPSHSNLMQSGFSLHLITWSLTPVSHNHHVPFSVIASHFPASSNRAASLHLCRFFCTAFLFLRQCQRWLEMQERKQQRWCFKLVLSSYLLRPNNSVPSEHSRSNSSY